MIVIGVDLAASARTTAIARLDGLRVTHLQVDVHDERIVELAGPDSVDKIGIDCPFGWPEDFVDFVLAHRIGHAARAVESIEDRRPLAYRATDVYCQRRGMRPLSVSADRIGHAGLRCAGLLRKLDVLDRSGSGRAAETYPAGSLRGWGLPSSGYKANLGDLPDQLLARIPLSFPATDAEHLFRTVDHAFDAVVAALTAAAVHLGLVEAIPARDRMRAYVEGWIRLPSCTLAELARAVAGSGP